MDETLLSDEQRAEITEMICGAVEVTKARNDHLFQLSVARALWVIAVVEVLRFLGAVAYWWYYQPWPHV